MDRDFLKKIVNDEVLFMNEVATELNITKQGVSNLVSRGQLTPVKTTSTGNLFLKMDVEEYKKQKQYARKYNKFHIFSLFSGYKKAGTALCSARPHILTCFLYFLFVKLFMRQ